MIYLIFQSYLLYTAFTHTQVHALLKMREHCLQEGQLMLLEEQKKPKTTPNLLLDGLVLSFQIH